MTKITNHKISIINNTLVFGTYRYDLYSFGSNLGSVTYDHLNDVLIFTIMPDFHEDVGSFIVDESDCFRKLEMSNEQEKFNIKFPNPQFCLDFVIQRVILACVKGNIDPPKIMFEFQDSKFFSESVEDYVNYKDHLNFAFWKSRTRY